MTDEHFGVTEAASWIAVPEEGDDKYSRGVVGFVTGSPRYPGAAVLGVEAALRTGVGMVRYIGPDSAAGLVLARRPEAVAAPGRVQAWVLGSGQDASAREEAEANRLYDALAEGLPTVLDGGALDLHASARGPLVLTPHARELARLTGESVEAIIADPATAALSAADRFGAVVLLKGHTTHLADPGGALLRVRSAPAWLATAGAGDALAGVLGALVATHHERLAADSRALLPLAAAAAVIHGLAAERASAGGPFTILDLCVELPHVVRALLVYG
ncbi:MAG: NAD(P)H-hydrate dehydratase [Leifsonia sp.]|nr:NAD(P)H-hydrate dehydratase [Leifsonia sp.]